MPHYEYECTQCGHHFEVFQRMSDPKLESCPQARGKIERLIGPGAGIVFKGSGFYRPTIAARTIRRGPSRSRQFLAGEAGQAR